MYSETIKITKTNVLPGHLSTTAHTTTQAQRPHQNIYKANYAFTGLHPALGRTAFDTLLAAYYNSSEDDIIWTYSTDDGATFDPGVLFITGGDYPSVKLWHGERFFGTHVTDSSDNGGGLTYLLEVTDPTDYDTYSLVYWDWSTYGWHDMIDMDIACDNSQEDWEWGISSFIISTTYGSNYTNGPTIIYSDEQTQYSAFISWFNYNGCNHTDVDIDPTTHYGYCVYDWYDTGNSTWKILLRVIDFANIETGFDTLYILEGAGNLINPAVAAYGDNVVILAQTDENGNDDIICLYSDDKFVTVHSSVVANSTADERYPDVRFDDEGNFICTYVMNNNLYALSSEDSGQTWTEPRKQINTNDDVVIEEYKTSDLCEKGAKTLWEEQHDDVEIYIGDVVVVEPPNRPPFSPTLHGQNMGAVNENLTFTVVSEDPDGDQLFYCFDWDDGMNTSWIGPYPSGEEVSIAHHWSTAGWYSVHVKVKDTSDAESDWSMPLEVNIFTLTPVLLLGGFLNNTNESKYVGMLFFGLYIQKPFTINRYSMQTPVFMIFDNTTRKGKFLPDLFNYHDNKIGVAIGRFDITIIQY